MSKKNLPYPSGGHEVKGLGHMNWITENDILGYICVPLSTTGYNHLHETWYTYYFWVKADPIWFGGRYLSLWAALVFDMFFASF